MFKLALPADLLETVRIAVVAVVEEVVAVRRDETVKVK